MRGCFPYTFLAFCAARALVPRAQLLFFLPRLAELLIIQWSRRISSAALRTHLTTLTATIRGNMTMTWGAARLNEPTRKNTGICFFSQNC